MKYLIIVLGLVLAWMPSAFSSEKTLLARVTVYWHTGGGQQRACWNGAKLRNGQCAVDPSKVPYGSKVVFSDGPCLAVDTGPAVKSRKAARVAGRTALQRNALVIDRYFESKKEAMAWAENHPHFITVGVVRPDSHSPTAAFQSEHVAATPVKTIKPSIVQTAAANIQQLGEIWSTSVAAAALCDIRGPLIPTFLARPDPES